MKEGLVIGSGELNVRAATIPWILCGLERERSYHRRCGLNVDMNLSAFLDARAAALGERLDCIVPEVPSAVPLAIQVLR